MNAELEHARNPIMATTKEDIRGWIRSAQEAGGTHLVVVCDTFDWEDYPVTILPKGEKLRAGDWDDVNAAIKHFDGPNMQKVVEVYNLYMDIEAQLKAHRSWNL